MIVSASSNMLERTATSLFVQPYGMKPSTTEARRGVRRSPSTDIESVDDPQESGRTSSDGVSVETADLTKRYGDVTAVDTLDLTIRRGEVYGFLGPNGAGKTTTLRMLLGLVHPTAGTVTVLGEQPGTAESLAKVGALVESPAFYPYLSGRRNLHVLASYAGVSSSRVETTLAQVELTERADDTFKSYSTGMKQRLGVAAALLNDPELLILDEPTTGLDPQGQGELRELIRTIGQGERTVLFSSHLMGEVEQICDRVGVIQHGELVTEGTVEELRGQEGLLVRADPLDRARKLVNEMDAVERVRLEDDALVVEIDTARAAEITRELVSSGVGVRELRPVERSLEDTFLELTEQQK